MKQTTRHPVEVTVPTFYVGDAIAHSKADAEALLPDCPTCGTHGVTHWMDMTTTGDKAEFVPGRVHCPVCWPYP